MLIAWLILGAVLLLFEMHHLAFFAMFGAIGSFAAAVVAALAPEAIALQAGVALGVGAVGVGAGRPFVGLVPPDPNRPRRVKRKAPRRTADGEG